MSNLKNIILNEITLQCRQCGKDKNIDAFYEGIYNACKICFNEFRNNKEKYRIKDYE